jgi:hypothetical protein
MQSELQMAPPSFRSRMSARIKGYSADVQKHRSDLVRHTDLLLHCSMNVPFVCDHNTRSRMSMMAICFAGYGAVLVKCARLRSALVRGHFFC